MCKAKSVDEFLKIVYEKIFKKDEEYDPLNIFWFRGESCKSCDYEDTFLVPGAYRNLVVKRNSMRKEKSYTISDEKYSSYFDIERNLRADFDRRALPFILSKGIENTAWNRYFLMQHYNVNTRLLDWTEDAIKALFFAINEDSDKDSKVWILQPFKLNLFTVNKLFDFSITTAIIPPLSNDHDKPQDLLDENGKINAKEWTRRYLTMDFDRDKDIDKKKYYPLAIQPSFLDNRMAAQKASFTIFGDVSNKGLHEVIELQDSCDKIIDCIVIDRVSKKEMLNQLRLIGIDNSSIYPDLDGLGNALKSKYRDTDKKVVISYDEWYSDVFK
jgi:hypothetical protein